jgi:hypothetical protein
MPICATDDRVALGIVNVVWTMNKLSRFLPVSTRKRRVVEFELRMMNNVRGST